jgi:hypothetical protein
MIPIDQILPEEKQLSGFFWAEAERPKKPKDIFLHPERTKRPDKNTVSAVADDEETEDTSTNNNRKQRNNTSNKK